MDDKAELLEALFDHYGWPWPSGHGNRSVRCPIHEDSHSSASVNTALGLFRCFTCSVEGDAFSVAMHQEGLDFARAKAFIEGLGGVERTRRPESDLLPRRGKRAATGKPFRPSWRI